MPLTNYATRNVTLTSTQKKELSKALLNKSPLILRLSKQQLSAEGGDSAIPVTSTNLNKINKNLERKGAGTDLKISKAMLAEFSRRLKKGDIPLGGILPESQVAKLKAGKGSNPPGGLNPPGLRTAAIVETLPPQPTEAVAVPAKAGAKKGKAKYIKEHEQVNIGQVAVSAGAPDAPIQVNHSTGTTVDSKVGVKKRRGVPATAPLRDSPVTSGS